MPDWSALRQRGRRRLGKLLEVCVDDPLGLTEAQAGGADRVELCAALALGGLTPTVGLMAAGLMAAGRGIRAHAMIRPRSGDFCFSPAETAVMRADIDAVRAAGLAGVVLGANLPDGRLAFPLLTALTDHARGLDLTLHRAIDLTPDPLAAVDQAIALGFHRILSSGGEKTAVEGIARLRAMMDHAAGRIVVMPGSGVSLATLPALRALPFTEIHASCAAPIPAAPRALKMGFASGTEKRTDRALVAALKTALRD